MPEPKTSFDLKSKTKILRKHNQSFFQEVPESNTCSDVGIPLEFCVCGALQNISTNATNVQMAIKKILFNANSYIMGQGGGKCAHLNLKKIHSAKIRVSEKVEIYVLSFTTNPGNFELKGFIEYSPKNGNFSGTSTAVHRMDSIKNDVKCVDDPHLELLCFCNRPNQIMHYIDFK
jgi:hypothetical protein